MGQKDNRERNLREFGRKIWRMGVVFLVATEGF